MEGIKKINGNDSRDISIIIYIAAIFASQGVLVLSAPVYREWSGPKTLGYSEDILRHKMTNLKY